MPGSAPGSAGPEPLQPGGWAGRSAQPSFTPAKPSFTPAQSGQAGEPAQAAQASAGQAEVDQSLHSEQSLYGDPLSDTGPGLGGQQAQPAQPGQSGFQPSGWPEQSFQVTEAAPDPQQHGWPEQPPQYSPEPGWHQGPYGGQQGGYPGGPEVGYPDGGPRPGRGYPVAPRPRRRHRVRRWVMVLFTIIVLLIVATIGDRVANAIAENEIANQFVKNGFPVKPSVSIEGFPFLTQLVAHDIHRVDISASNVPAGPVSITSVKATATGVHLNSSFNGGTVDHIAGTVFVSFASLASAGGGGSGTGISMSADGPGKVKITADVAGQPLDSEVARVSRTGPSEITVQVQPSGSPLSGLLTSFGSYSFTIPKLPAGMEITGVAVTSQGITVSAAGNHTKLTQPGS